MLNWEKLSSESARIFSSRFTDTITGVFNACTNSETRNFRSIQAFVDARVGPLGWLC